MKRRILVALGVASVAIMLAIGYLAFKARELRSMIPPKFYSDIRQVYSAQRAYTGLNGGFYDRRLECVARPRDCIPDLDPSTPGLLDDALAGLPDQDGYSRRFVPGPLASLEAIARAGASHSSTRRWVLLTIGPAEGAPARIYCIDHTGTIRTAETRDVPALENAVCPPEWGFQ